MRKFDDAKAKNWLFKYFTKEKPNYKITFKVLKIIFKSMVNYREVRVCLLHSIYGKLVNDENECKYEGIDVFIANTTKFLVDMLKINVSKYGDVGDVVKVLIDVFDNYQMYDYEFIYEKIKNIFIFHVFVEFEYCGVIYQHSNKLKWLNMFYGELSLYMKKHYTYKMYSNSELPVYTIRLKNILKYENDGKDIRFLYKGRKFIIEDVFEDKIYTNDIYEYVKIEEGYQWKYIDVRFVE